MGREEREGIGQALGYIGQEISRRQAEKREWERREKKADKLFERQRKLAEKEFEMRKGIETHRQEEKSRLEQEAWGAPEARFERNLDMIDRLNRARRKGRLSPQDQRLYDYLWQDTARDLLIYDESGAFGRPRRPSRKGAPGPPKGKPLSKEDRRRLQEYNGVTQSLIKLKTGQIANLEYGDPQREAVQKDISQLYDDLNESRAALKRGSWSAPATKPKSAAPSRAGRPTQPTGQWMTEKEFADNIDQFTREARSRGLSDKEIRHAIYRKGREVGVSPGVVEKYAPY